MGAVVGGLDGDVARVAAGVSAMCSCFVAAGVDKVADAGDVAGVADAVRLADSDGVVSCSMAPPGAVPLPLGELSSGGGNCGSIGGAEVIWGPNPDKGRWKWGLRMYVVVYWLEGTSSVHVSDSAHAKAPEGVGDTERKLQLGVVLHVEKHFSGD